MDDKYVSPSKFSTLPEDLKAKVLHGARLGTLTQQHRGSFAILQERINDAGNKPFSPEEVQWILHEDVPICVFYGRDRNLVAIELSKPFDKNGKILRTEIIRNHVVYSWRDNSVRYDLGRNGYEEETSIDFNSPMHEQLVGRLDSSIIKVAPDTDEHDIVLVDIRTLYRIFRRRFDIVAPTRSIELARKYTQQVLDNIIDDRKLCFLANHSSE